MPNRVLPENISKGQSLHDSSNGQHLSRFSYNAYADFIADQLERYTYRKMHPLLAYNAGFHGNTNVTVGQITKLGTTDIVIPVERIGTAGNGGHVPGSTTILKLCAGENSDTGLVDEKAQGFQFAARNYRLQDGIAGNGFALNFDAGGTEGVIEVILGVCDRAINVNEAISGEAVLSVEADSVAIFSEQLKVGAHFKKIAFPQCYSVKAKITLASDLPTAVRLSSLMAWAKSSRTPSAPIFKSGDRIAFMKDSWWQYPVIGPGETPPERPDGSGPGEGMQFISERLQQRLSNDGIKVTTRNWSKGGMTSAWGRYWVDKIIEDRLTHCIVHFGINDFNGRNNVATNTPSACDFSPANLWSSQSSAVGGVFGSVSPEQWRENIIFICRRLVAAGIKPIALGMPFTASAAQTQTSLQVIGSRGFGGDELMFELSGRT